VVTRIVGATFLLGWLLGPIAFAGSLPEVAVLGVHVAGLDAERGEALSRDLVDALELSGLLNALSPSEVEARLVGREELVIEGMAMRAGIDLLRSGRMLYERAQPDQAIPELQRATRALAHGALITGQTRDLIESWLLLGLAQFGMGDLDAARAAWRHVAVLSPTRELDTLNYPPSVIAEFQSVREEVAQLDQAVLEVKTNESVAEVVVDGRSVGSSPVRIEGLAPGQHFIYAIDELGHRAGRRVVLEPGAAISVSFAMDGYQLGIASSKSVGRARQTRELYEALGQHTRTDLILLAGLSGEGFVAVQLYSPLSGNFSKTITAEALGEPVQAILDLMPAVATYATVSGDIRSDRVALVVPPLDVTANAILTQILLAADSPTASPQQPGPGPATTVGNAKWFAVAGAAVVAGGVGGGLAVWWSRQGGETENPDDGTIVMSID
jgi:hypothetical protein